MTLYVPRLPKAQIALCDSTSAIWGVQASRAVIARPKHTSTCTYLRPTYPPPLVAAR